MHLSPHQEWACQWGCRISDLFINIPSSLGKAYVVIANLSLCNFRFASLADQIPLPPGRGVSLCQPFNEATEEAC